MDRRTFLITMLQGTLAATLLPHSISPLLIAQYASLHHLGEIPQQNMRIAALGVGQFGALCGRMLAYSVHNISGHVLASSRHYTGSFDFSQLPLSIQQPDLLFLLADASQPSSASQLATCIDAATAAGLQTVLIGPSAAHLHSSRSTDCASLPVCTVADPATVRDLVALVADLVNTDSFVGIDHGDIKAILRSGSHGLFSCSEATGADRESLASSQALEKLQQQGLDSANCRGAMACIYGSPAMSFDYYAQAASVMDGYFSNDITFVFGAIPDEQLAADTIKVAILAMR
ncbi:hypothetical protein FY034_00050 [Trichlorobacter lovleyi]|uniref:hypothetical protein n=1 Tax=Trichlorobacter lovleyi TaxID=313985 RepID=UPI002240A298|nr:hypothetical protein [Trichlorobacter lovleyi]QOX77399.1 hypothetical protein FY034_00050 [Trichlorobacter lovleyi]